MEPGTFVFFSVVGKPTGIPIAEVVFPEFPVDAGDDTGIPVPAFIELLAGAVSAGFDPGKDTGFDGKGATAVDARFVDIGGEA